MHTRTLLAGVLATIAMFCWTSLAHTVLPLREAGIRQIDNEQGLLQSMQSTLSAPGFYMFPNMPADRDQAQYEKQITTGPSGLLIYFPRRDFSFPKLLGVEFVNELVEVLIATVLLSFAGMRTFGGRLGFFALIGVMVALGASVSYWNWYGFPTAYTVAYMFTVWMGFVVAGLVAAALKVGSPAAG